MSGKDDVVPLPEIIVGQETDDSGNPMNDDSGNPILQSGFDAILSAIYALAKEVRTMDSTINTNIAVITADLADLKTKLGQGPAI